MIIKDIVDRQREYFYTNETLPVSYRKEKLQLLLKKIEEKEKKIYQALYRDLNKSEYEAYLTEVSLVTQEIRQMIKYLSKWTKPQKKKNSLSTILNKSFTILEPYGVVLIISPWNYPFQLTMMPLIGAIAAGNCAVIKCSNSSPHVTEVIREIIEEIYPNHYVYVTDNQHSHDHLFENRYDYIFFTGSQRVGRLVMREAAETLTPLTLELGGKSPVFVDETADVKDTAKKIIWGKLINSGQTCVAPDYILVKEEIKEKLIEELKNEIEKNYNGCEHSEHYPKIINLHHFIRLKGLIERENHIIGGMVNEEKMKIAPAIIPNASFHSESMREEIFGPILPIIGYGNLEDLLDKMRNKNKPLAAYIFTKNKKTIEMITKEFSFGGGCINDCILHLANDYLPFGGVGASGMGSYHGIYSLQTFSHEKSILWNQGIYDIPHRFYPFTEKKLKQLRKILKL